MANEDKGPWWVVGIQIHAAMDPARDGVETFLAEHAKQATHACLGFLRTIPRDAEVDLVPLVEELGEQILAHTRFLCVQAELGAPQAARLMAASRLGLDRFVEAFQAEVRAGGERPRAGLLRRIEATLATESRFDASHSPSGARCVPEPRHPITSAP